MNKLICQCGQSNGLGYGTIGQPYPGGWTANPKIKIWTADGFKTYAPGSNANGLGSPAFPTAFGAEGQFAKNLWLRNPADDVFIYKRSPIGIGLTPTDVDNWSVYETGKGKQFDLMVAELKCAQEAACGIPIDAFVYQGCETDALTTAQADRVLRHLALFFAAVRAQFNSPNMVAIVPQVSSRIVPVAPGYPAMPTVQWAQNYFSDTGPFACKGFHNAVSFPIDSFPYNPDFHLNNVGVYEAGEYCHAWYSQIRP